MPVLRATEEAIKKSFLLVKRELKRNDGILPAKYYFSPAFLSAIGWKGIPAPTGEAQRMINEEIFSTEKSLLKKKR